MLPMSGFSPSTPYLHFRAIHQQTTASIFGWTNSGDYAEDSDAFRNGMNFTIATE